MFLEVVLSVYIYVIGGLGHFAETNGDNKDSGTVKNLGGGMKFLPYILPGVLRANCILNLLFTGLETVLKGAVFALHSDGPSKALHPPRRCCR